MIPETPLKFNYQSMGENIGRSQSETVAIVDVNVIPMDSERICEHQTILIKDDRISEIGAVDEIVYRDEFSHKFWIDYVPNGLDMLDWEIDMSLIEEVAESVAEHNAEVTATFVPNELDLLGLEDMDTLLQRADIRNTRSQIGVILRGSWFSQTELDQMVTNFVAAYNQ